MFIDKWTQALRSDKYTQGTGLLYNAEDDTFCPLGVACDLVNPRFRNRKPEMLDCANFVVPMGHEVMTLKKNYPLLESYISVLNDVCGLTFKEIAWEIDNLEAGICDFYDYYTQNDGPAMIIELSKMVRKGI